MRDRWHESDRPGVGFERSAVGQALTSIVGRFLVINEAFAKMLGYACAEMEGMAFNDVTHPDDRVAGADAMATLIGGRDSLRFETRYVTRSGSTVWVDVSVALVRESDGEPDYFVGTYVDITERKRAEEALAASERRYRRLFEAAMDGILILDAETGRIVDVNPYLTELTGYTHEEFLGKHLWEIGPFKDIAASRASFAELQAQQYVRYDDLPLKTRDLRTIDVEFVSNVYRVEDQKVIQCNIRNISDRKRAESQLVRLATAIEQAAEMVVVTDAMGVIEYVNPAFEAVTGYAREDVLGHNPRLLKSNMQDEAFYSNLWATISSGRTWHGRMVNKRKDGGLYTEESTISAVRDAAGAITSYVAVKRDITRDLAVQEQFLHSQKMEGIGSLAGGVAHDFNNLMSVILSYTDFAMDGLHEGERLWEDLQEVRKAGERAVVLTRQLLAFSRKQVLQPVLLDLNGIAEGVEKMLQRIVGEDIDLVQVLAPDLGLTLADPGQIEQVLMNLVVNSRDAMPRGGDLTIETSNVQIDAEYAGRHVAVEPGPYVLLSVTDTGCGMSEQTRARLFEPFFTTKEKGKGTGLGLSTVYGIVKQSGGNIWVYSEPGNGTTFKIYLPRVLDATIAATVKPSATAKRAAGTETILVVEDERALLEVARRALDAAGYTLLTAASGEDALAIAAQHAGHIDLLVTDVVMPRMNGRSLALALTDARPTVKVLYMSGYTGDAIVHHGVLDAGTQFLGKPFTAAQLTRKVREVLDDPRSS